ncbi:MAG: pyridoxamine 5'-phosphate oxidase family protein [Candidatus Paceibacterota bacterium]
MQKEIIDFVHSQFLSVLAVEMMDGSPHVATMHYAFSDEPQMFLFETYRPHRKSEALFGRDVSRASMVIGFDENNRKTLQIDGEVKLLTSDTERLIFNKIYFKKFPNKKEKSKDPKFVFFSFIPKWWRFTDWDAPGGKKIVSSEEK